MTFLAGFIPSLINENDQFSRLPFSLFVVLLLSWSACVYAKSRKRTPPLPPGPRGLPFVGSLLSLEPELHSHFAKLAQVHGPIMKLGLGNKLGIVVSSPSMAREVLKDHDVTFANRDVPAGARAATYGGSDIVWTPYGPQWRMLRKVCVLKMLSNATLDSFYTLRRKQVRGTVAYIYSRAGCPVNIGEQTFLTVLNVITGMLWGGTVEGETRAVLAADFKDVVSEITVLLGKPNISDFFPILARFDLQGVVRQMEKVAQRFDVIFERVIDERRKIDREIGNTTKGSVCARGSKDFLQFLMKLKDENDSKTPLTLVNLKALFMDMVVGGTDTSSNAIDFAMAEIMNNPEVMRKVQEELEAVIGKDNVVEESHIHKLPYLRAVMKETLRLHPPVPLLVPHCPSETCTVGGYTIPKGSQVFVNAWAIQRDPSIWENPLNFNPERFLNDKWDFNGNDFSYLPFGSGRRICAGTVMAERMVMFSLATLLHSFDWSLPDGEKLDLTEKTGIVMKKKIPLVAIPTPRLRDTSLYQ